MLKSQTLLDAIIEVTAEGCGIRFWRDDEDIIAVMISDPVEKTSVTKMLSLTGVSLTVAGREEQFLWLINEAYKQLKNRKG